MPNSTAASVLLLYTAVALLLLFLLSYPPGGPHRPHRRLKIRSSSSAHDRSIPFDPIISDIERRLEDREWKRAHSPPPLLGEPEPEDDLEWEDFMDAEEYINHEDQFNVTLRVVELFPKIDVGPADGLVTAVELTEWNLRQAERQVMHRTEREMDLNDRDRDGFISFHEYEPPSWSRRSPDDTSSGYDMGWWKEDHFNASDVDGNGLLNLTEFNDFLHPADSSNPRLIQWLCKEEIRERDKNKDGKLDFQDFFHGLFDLIRDYDEVDNISHQSDTSMEAPAKIIFSQLDQNNDGFLSEDELKPVIGTIHHSERYYAKHQADYAISQADMDKDGRLSLKEMTEKPYIFYSHIFTDDDDYGYHDEFR